MFCSLVALSGSGLIGTSLIYRGRLPQMVCQVHRRPSCCDVSAATVQAGLLFNSGCLFEISALLLQIQASKALNVLIFIQSASCQTWSLVFCLRSLEKKDFVPDTDWHTDASLPPGSLFLCRLENVQILLHWSYKNQVTLFRIVILLRL